MDENAVFALWSVSDKQRDSAASAQQNININTSYYNSINQIHFIILVDNHAFDVNIIPLAFVFDQRDPNSYIFPFFIFLGSSF